MPLRVWLPLDNNYANRGIDGSVAAEGGVFETPGKTSAYCWRSSSRISVPYKYASTDKLSVCMWVKPNGALAWTSMFGWGNTSTRSNRIEIGSNAGSTYWFFGSNDCLIPSNTTITTSIPDLTWTHFAMVADGTTVRFYANGALVKSVAQKSQVSATFDGHDVFYFGGYVDTYNGYYNDVRIYDHALSTKEVYELSRGMIIHYGLSNPYSTGMLNMYSLPRAGGDSSSSSFTKTKLVGEDGYNFKLTRTGTGTSTWPAAKFPGVSRANFTAGKKYTWSAKVRCHKWTVGTLTLRTAIYDNDWAHGGVTVCSPALADGQWHQYSRTLTLTEGMAIGSKYYYLTNAAYEASTEASKGYMEPRVEFFSSDQKTEGTVYDMDFDIKEIQIVEADAFPGWVDNSMVSNIVRDNTGRGNDAKCVGTIVTEAGSPRNGMAYRLLNPAYIEYKIPAGLSQCTIAFWVKRESTNSYGALDIAKNNPPGGMWLSLNTEGSKLWAYWGGVYNSVWSVLDNNKWYHVAMTFNAGISQWYFNGVAVGSAVDFSSKGTTWPSGTRTIGNSYTGSTWNTTFSGSVSDWRFYATVLSAADIKHLYDVSASIDDNGDMFASSFEETENAPSIAKNGLVYGSHFTESGGTQRLFSAPKGAPIYPNSPPRTFTPTTAQNSTVAWYFFECIPGIQTYHITMRVDWSGFEDITTTNPTFDAWFQGTARRTDGSGNEWTASSFTTALNNHKRLGTLAKGSASGTYLYDMDFTLSSYYPGEYIGQYLGMRSDYSNGIGSFSISNIRICPVAEYKLNAASLCANGAIQVRLLDESA